MCASKVTLMVECVLSDARSSWWLESRTGLGSCRNSLLGSLWNMSEWWYRNLAWSHNCSGHVVTLCVSPSWKDGKVLSTVHWSWHSLAVWAHSLKWVLLLTLFSFDNFICVYTLCHVSIYPTSLSHNHPSPRPDDTLPSKPLYCSHVFPLLGGLWTYKSCVHELGWEGIPWSVDNLAVQRKPPLPLATISCQYSLWEGWGLHREILTGPDSYKDVQWVLKNNAVSCSVDFVGALFSPHPLVLIVYFLFSDVLWAVHSQEKF